MIKRLIAKIFLSKEMIDIAHCMKKNNCKVVTHKIPSLFGTKRVYEVVRNGKED